MSASEALACPRCGRGHPPNERFCDACSMPLVPAGTSPLPARDEIHARARKVRPEYSRGRLVRVAGGRNQAEAELIQNLLLEEGVPSVLRRSAGFDVPDFLAAGPRDVMVPESGARAAHELLSEAELVTTPRRGAQAPSGRQALVVLAAILVGAAATALVAWLLLAAT